MGTNSWAIGLRQRTIVAVGLLIAFIILMFLAAPLAIRWLQPSIPATPTGMPPALPTSRPGGTSSWSGTYAIHLANGMEFKVDSIRLASRKSGLRWLPNGTLLSTPFPTTQSAEHDLKPGAECEAVCEIRLPAGEGFGYFSFEDAMDKTPWFWRTKLNPGSAQTVRELLFGKLFYGAPNATLYFSGSIGPWETIAKFDGVGRSTGQPNPEVKMIVRSNIPNNVTYTVQNPTQSSNYAYGLIFVAQVNGKSVRTPFTYPSCSTNGKVIPSALEVVRSPLQRGEIQDIHTQPSTR
jgi:hypothetical protein